MVPNHKGIEMKHKLVDSACLLAAAFVLAAPAGAQDVAAGKKIFKRCSACHQIGDTAKNGAGPVLTNVVGRLAGTYPGFKYGKGMQEASEKGLVWTADLIAEYITDPKKYLRAFTGNKRAKAKMKFKLKNEQQRLDVIAYISTFSEAPAEPVAADSSPQAAVAPFDAPENAVCVTNRSAESHFFAAESSDGSRVTGEIAPGGTLCTGAGATAQSGKVSVFEQADDLEGCTRLVKSNTVEALLKYADFDRCLWSSNQG